MPFRLESVMDDLKDFQRRTVNYVFQRMYHGGDQTHRFLVADEAGLGKTMVARGVIAQTVKHLWDDIDRIDVIYICSNADIARQNINRLNITEKEDFVLSSRITLLPTQLKDLRGNKLNFVSFTPGTSFNLRSTLGIWSERVLLYWLLDQAWGISKWGTGPKNVLRGYASADPFREAIDAFDLKSIDSSLRDDFLRALDKRIKKTKKEGGEDLRSLFEDLSNRFQWKRMDHRIPDTDKQDRARFIGTLRAMLAQVCLTALEPDLIILDEFQRFKHLLSGEDEASLLAQDLFTYTDAHTDVRVLLLSATPYKMYTLSHEEGENHYQDFIDTLRFLQHDPEKTEAFRDLLDRYRMELLRLGSFGVDRLLSLQHEIEESLRSYMVRTERLGDTKDRNGMLIEASNQVFEMGAEDINDYLVLDELADIIGHRNPVEYWKSSPYLLNFMDNYKLKVKFEKAVLKYDAGSPLHHILKNGHSLFMPWEKIRKYEPVGFGNARLRHLMDTTIERDMWKLLWAPPSFSYYKLASPFDTHDDFTKQLIFSSWVVVPKTVSTLTSYEAERRIFSAYDSVYDYTGYSDRRQLLNFALSNERLTGMPVLGILYPSFTLARACDPYQLSAELDHPSSIDVLALAEKRIQKILDDLPVDWGEESRVPDETWYWVAPILMDIHSSRSNGRDWLFQERLHEIWSGGDERALGRWIDHVEEARKVVDSPQLGRPPDDLVQVLAKMGLGGPGVCALRALSRVADGPRVLEDIQVRNGAAQIAWGFRSFFNQPEAIAIIRGINAEEPYWERLLEYSIAGGIQAVLDEFTHILRESLGLFDYRREVLVQEIAEKMLETLTLRTVNLGVDDIRWDGSQVKIEDRRMRAHFCVRFGDESSEYSDEPTRADQVRSAFNSPFWPFVLVTTSVGQEGLDFHQYCHKVVHWNLPSNPVDLEQREGRVHRYKCHAVRKNVARECGDYVMSLTRYYTDPWKGLFKIARYRYEESRSELTPFWIFPSERGARIERHVPALPLSREQRKLIDLRQSLAVYRMVFGQPRQEELIDYLQRHLSDEEIDEMVEKVKIDLSPPGIE